MTLHMSMSSAVSALAVEVRGRILGSGRSRGWRRLSSRSSGLRTALLAVASSASEPIHPPSTRALAGLPLDENQKFFWSK